MMFIAEASQGLPDPNHFASIGWLIVGLAGVLTILKLVLDLWKDHFKPNPPHHLTYLTIAEHKEVIEEMTGRIEGAVQKIEQFSSANYEARKRMHKKINLFANAFSYLAGTLARDGRVHDSAHLKTLIDKAYEDNGEED